MTTKEKLNALIAEYRQNNEQPTQGIINNVPVEISKNGILCDNINFNSIPLAIAYLGENNEQ